VKRMLETVSGSPALARVSSWAQMAGSGHVPGACDGAEIGTPTARGLDGKAQKGTRGLPFFFWKGTRDAVSLD
jgi:hypothetical protein